ncbi:CHASE3 domain-containing protein [Acidobacterium sp. S8]|uniref:sensor histidine kinase n=1 Tax=Acidobacterium sp. S8 TaxID=1641854 RepID=UPI001C204168|nr:CHASE3 domain-containing protein [Acidobacterium sp. S8]
MPGNVSGMKERTSRPLFSALLVGGILIVTINAVLALRAVGTLANNESWVAHTWQVLNTVERVMGSLKDSETGMRGYLITGEEAYLAPYTTAQKELPQELNQLQSLTSDNPQQQDRIVLMRQVVAKRLQALEGGIEERRRGKTESSRLLGFVGTGKEEMDQLRGIASAMQLTEQDLLKARVGSANTARQRALATMIGASALDIILLILLFLNLNHERELRKKADDAAERLQELQSISDAALTRLTFAELSEELLERLRTVTRADGVVLCMWHDGEIEATAANGITITPGRRIRLSPDDPVYRAVTSNHVITLTGTESKHISIEGFSGEMQAALVLPLTIGDRVLGVLMAGLRKADAFKDTDEKLLSVVADRIALSIDRANIYEAERDARKQAEVSAAEVRTLNEELETRVRIRTAELEAANRELEAFSYSVSHDLRAPLRSVDGISVALEEDYGEELTAEARDFLRRIRAGVQKMGQLIDALLQLSRITRAELTREDVDVSALTEEVVADLRQQNPERNLTFHIQPEMHADADIRLLRVALENLLGNAVKFTAKNDTALIEVGRDNSTGAFFVRDNGAGFDMQYATKLFTAFQRLHGDRDFKGSGIGLATVSRVIRRHGGKTWAEGSPNVGATFSFTLA